MDNLINFFKHVDLNRIMSTCFVLVIFIIGFSFRFIPPEKLSKIQNYLYTMSKRNVLKIITVCFWIYMIISFVALTQECVLTLEFSRFSAQNSSPAAIMYIIQYWFKINFIFILIYLSIKFAVRRFKKDRLSKVDFINYKGYYRDILKKYSPAELSYIDNFEVSPRNDIPATLLSLNLKGKISFDKYNERIIIENDNVDDLSGNEILVFNSIINGKVSYLDDSIFIKKVKEDALKNNLLSTSKFVTKFLNKVLVFIILFVLFMICLCFIFARGIHSSSDTANIFLSKTLAFSGILMICLPLAIGAYMYTYLSKNEKNEFVRTSMGEDINEKLEGLKNYLKDYSSIDEMNENSLALWEDYLIYSVIFSQNDTAVKNICNKYISL